MDSKAPSVGGLTNNRKSQKNIEFLSALSTQHNADIFYCANGCISARPITINATKCRGMIWPYKTASDGGRLKHQHPATFPDRLPYDFIECFCAPDGTVLDPFMGSGTTVVATRNLNRGYIGIDIAEEYCDIARQRLKRE